MIRIGLDQSINSTSVCVIEEGKKPIYYIIVPKMTKKQSAANHDRICYFKYDKINSNLNHNIRCISEKISQIIANKCALCTDPKTEVQVTMEDIALMAKGRSIIDLSILNGYIRCSLDKLGVPYKTIPPTQWKKELLGNGQADKELVIMHWSKLDPDAYNQLSGCKSDDVADSFFIANFFV